MPFPSVSVPIDVLPARAEIRLIGPDVESETSARLERSTSATAKAERTGSTWTHQAGLPDARRRSRFPRDTNMRAANWPWMEAEVVSKS